MTLPPATRLEAVLARARRVLSMRFVALLVDSLWLPFTIKLSFLFKKPTLFKYDSLAWVRYLLENDQNHVRALTYQ